MEYRTDFCGSLRLEHVGKKVTLAGWVHRVRRLGQLLFIDLRDRWGIAQLVVEEGQAELLTACEVLGREWVVQATGTVRERASKNASLPTGDVEVELCDLKVLNPSEVPPFTIVEDTDGGDELRMKYRYLDLRREPLQRNLMLRHRLAQAVREYLNGQQFMEIETPFLIKSTPEGARDYVVPSRLHHGEFYSLPQSPQTFKQLLMVAGYERYYQIVRCFRDEDLRADRQPEFTQIDCEMAFVHREDVLMMFEGFMRTLFKKVLGVEFPEPFRRMPYQEAMARYGSDKPDLRVAMEIADITNLAQACAFQPFREAEYTGAINAKGLASIARKGVDALTDFVKRPQIGAKGLVYFRVQEDGSCKSSADKYLTQEQLQGIAQQMGCAPGDMVFIISGKRMVTLKALGELRLEVARQHNMLDPMVFKPLWVVDFPLFEWSEEDGRFFAMHHPFTSPLPEDRPLFDTDPGSMRANAYDMVINGVEVGGGSIRIHQREVQEKMFQTLGFTQEAAQEQFGFLMNAFRYGAPPHGGIAFGFDRICSIFGGCDSIRDFIAFPKNNAARDVMISAPSHIADAQLEELHLDIRPEHEANS